MSRIGILGVTALSLTLAVATPAFAEQLRGGGGVRAGGGMQVAGSGVRTGGGPAQTSSFRGAQASAGTGNVSGSTQFTQGGFRGDRDRRFGGGAGFVAGLAAGSALGYYGDGYDPYYYGDSYAYSDYYDDGYYPADVAVVAQAGIDPAYCAQRYRSYDPATGTYLGFDGLRHPCP
jgi:hypothetical protein